VQNAMPIQATSNITITRLRIEASFPPFRSL
jgi:hypothetical protein